MKTTIKRGTAGMLLVAFASLGACGGESGVALDDAPVAPEPTAAGEETVLARIDGDRGAYVEWLAPINEGEEPGVAILIAYPDRALLDPDFLDTHSALEAYLAVAPVDAEVPAALLAYPGAIDPALLAPGAERRLALRRENQALLDARPALDATASPSEKPGQGPQAGSDCDSAFNYAVKLEYGNGYGDDKTCGTNTGFSENTFSTYYCEPGPGNDCSYPIAGLAGCYPAGDPSCSAFEGELQVHRVRSVLGNSADLVYNMTGHRYRFSAANCEHSGNLTMNRQRGAGDWISATVGPRQMLIYVQGAAYPVPNANPTYGVAYGLWKQLIPKSGSTYLMNRLTVSTGASQEAIVCGDVWRRFETFDISAYGCNFNNEFCEPNTSCEGGCW